MAWTLDDYHKAKTLLSQEGAITDPEAFNELASMVTDFEKSHRAVVAEERGAERAQAASPEAILGGQEEPPEEPKGPPVPIPPSNARKLGALAVGAARGIYGPLAQTPRKELERYSPVKPNPDQQLVTEQLNAQGMAPDVKGYRIAGELGGMLTPVSYAAAPAAAVQRAVAPVGATLGRRMLGHTLAGATGGLAVEGSRALAKGEAPNPDTVAAGAALGAGLGGVGEVAKGAGKLGALALRAAGYQKPPVAVSVLGGLANPTRAATGAVAKQAGGVMAARAMQAADILEGDSPDKLSDVHLAELIPKLKAALQSEGLSDAEKKRVREFLVEAEMKQRETPPTNPYEATQ